MPLPGPGRQGAPLSAPDRRPVEHARFPVGLLRDQIVAVLAAWDVPDDLARATAAVMADTDLAGIDSHGIAMLP